MKHFVKLVVSVCVCILGAVALGDGRLDEIYRKIEAASSGNTPRAYTVIVENKRFAEALAELPEDVMTGKGEPAVSVVFRKGEGVKIVIRNVKSEYASLFSMYEDYLRFSGISKVQNPVEFKEIIEKDKVEIQSEDDNFIVVKAWDPTKEEKDGNFAHFHIDKSSWVIKKAVYFLDGVPYVEAENNYKSFGNYYLPSKIVLSYKNDETSDVFLFKNYKFQE